jgi:hypothetical protein
MIHAGRLFVVVSLTLIASGSVPTAFDFASCNAEARDAVKTGGRAASSAVPSTKDHRRAVEAQRGETRESDDAQLSGMNADGAKDPAFQAAYRICMRRSGF